MDHADCILLPSGIFLVAAPTYPIYHWALVPPRHPRVVVHAWRTVAADITVSRREAVFRGGHNCYQPRLCPFAISGWLVRRTSVFP